MSVAARAMAAAHTQTTIATLAAAAPSIPCLNDPVRFTNRLITEKDSFSLSRNISHGGRADNANIGSLLLVVSGGEACGQWAPHLKFGPEP
jgi:hypothetical protein